MSKLSRSKVGKAKGLTRNQKRKADYAAKAALEQAENRRHGVKGKHLSAKTVRLVGAAVHQRPCGNVACQECFYHIPGEGIYPRGSEPKYPGKVINGERFRTPEDAQARGLTW